MPVIDSVNRKGVRGANSKRVTKGPNWLVGPKSGDTKSDFARLSGIRGAVDLYEITDGTGTQNGSYTFTIRPFAERGFPALHRAVGDVAVLRQIGGIANPSAAITCQVRKRPYSGSVPLVVGPIDVLDGDRLWIVVENKDASTLKYKLDVAFDVDNQASLDLRFAETKSLVDATTGANLIDFTRASSGTYVDSEGVIRTATTNEPRFDHDPTTGESLGLLVEEQRTNLLQKTEEFDDGVIWSTSSLSRTENNALSPNGTTTADSLTSSGTAVASQSITKAASSITYAASLFVNTSTVEELSLTIDDGATVNRGRAVFTLSSGAHLAVNDGNFTGTISSYEPYGNGWVRLIVSTTTNSATVARFRFFWTGPGTSLAVWGAQLEVGSFPTSYIPTTDATVTRAADVASISGSNFFSWFNATQGSIYANWITQTSNGFANVYQFNAGAATTNLIEAYRNNSDTSISVRIRESAGTQRTLTYTAQQWTGRNNIVAHAYQADDMQAAINGSINTSAITAMILPSPNALELGNANGRTPSNCLNGHLRRFTFWPARLPNETLQVITQ